MPKKVSRFAKTEQPINWSRAILCGIFGSWILMAWMDIFAMMGVTPLSLEVYVGNIVRTTETYSPRSWIVGFFTNWVIGAIAAIFYSYCFEYVYRRANGRLGSALGVGHAVIAAVAIFPFFEIIGEQMGLPGTQIGVFGFDLGIATPVLLLIGHVLFGLTVGTFYGAVRAERIRDRAFEPGDLGLPGEPGVITEAEDALDNQGVYRKGA